MLCVRSSVFFYCLVGGVLCYYWICIATAGWMVMMDMIRTIR